MNLYDDVDVWAGMVGRSVRETQAELAEWVETEPGCWVRRMKKRDDGHDEQEPNEV